MKRFALLIALFVACIPAMATAQASASGGSSGGERPYSATCAIGSTACVEQQNQLCRNSGGSISARTINDGFLSVSCVSGPGALTSGPDETRGCQAGSACLCSGSSNGGFGSVYMCMNNMINECLSSGGKAVGLGIYPDANNDGISTASGSCIHR